VFESRAGDQQNSDEGFERNWSDAGPRGEARSEKMGAAVWAEIRVPVVRPEGWPVHHLRMGLRELERLRREVEAAMALLTGAMPESRDTVADIARNAGISDREARRRKSVADVCGKVKGALEKLQSGAISNEHVSALAPVADMPGAASLLDDAESKSPEELVRDVEEFRLSAACGDDMAKRQRARRSLRFFTGPEGMIGINGLLPPVEGTELRNRLAAIVDAKWRSEHPDRAKVLGGHGGDAHDQRMADALLAIAGVYSPSSEETQSSEPRSIPISTPNAPPAASPTTVKTGKPAVVIVFDVDRWKARIAGGGPIPINESLLDQARNDLYYCFKNMVGEVIKFGRSRRDPTPVQRLLLVVRDEKCLYPGCHAPPDSCDAHHLNEVVKDEGPTDTELMGLFCEAHHRHIHVNDLVAKRNLNGSLTITERRTGVVVAFSNSKRAT
jgi:Domain of unknown function (DUF222)